MPLVFPNVSVLGLNQETRFFGAGFEYASFRRLSVGGLVTDLTESFGITGVWTGSQGVLATIRNNPDYQPLVLNGVSFGSGRVESISFDAGLDVRTKAYTASILVFDSGNLFNLTGVYYSGINTSNWQYLSAFSEDYSFSKPLNGGYGYSHNATIQFTSGVGQLAAIPAAQALARTLFTGSNLGFAFYPGFTNKQGKRYITESVNLIDNTCGFTETFEFDSNSGAYSATYTTNLQLAENGVLTATEQGSVRGIENPNYQKALSAVGQVMAGSYLRVSGAAAYYFPTGALLLSAPTSQSRNIDIFTNNVDYTVIFDNAPANQRFYFWDYTLQAERQDGISSVTEQGTVLGRGNNPTTSFAYAQSGWAIVKPGIGARTTALFVNQYAPSTNYLDLKEESYSPQQGQISYSYRYSNDPTLISNAGIRRKVVTQEDDAVVYSYNKINILNVAEIAQNDRQSTHGATTISVDMEGDATVALSTYLTAAIAEVNARAPVGNDRYVGATSYTYSPNDGSVNVQLTWLFNRSASQTIYP